MRQQAFIFSNPPCLSPGAKSKGSTYLPAAMSDSPSITGALDHAMDHAGAHVITQIAAFLILAALLVLHRGLAACERRLDRLLREQEQTHTEARERAGDMDYMRMLLKGFRAHEAATEAAMLRVETSVASLCLKLDEPNLFGSSNRTASQTGPIRPEHSGSFNRHRTFEVEVQDSPRGNRAPPSAASRPNLSDSAKPPEPAASSWLAVMRRLRQEEPTPSSGDVECSSASSPEGALRFDSVEVEQVLAHKHRRDGDGRVPLHACGATDNVRVATLLLEDGANLNSQDVAGATPLHLCGSADSVGVAKLLLDAGADTEMGIDLDHGPLYAGATPLHVCGTSGSVRVAKLLLDANADKDAQDDIGLTVLHMCSLSGSVGVAELLIGAGADLEARDEQHGMTALHLCCCCNNARVAQLLLDAGADREAKDGQGRTAQDMCRKAQSLRVLALLS